MPDEQSSPEAMQAAQAILDARLDGLTFSGHIKEVAAIIDEHTKPKWKECSKRMPTEEDGNDRGNVLWGNSENPWLDSWDCYGLEPFKNLHPDPFGWMPLPNDPEPEDAT